MGASATILSLDDDKKVARTLKAVWAVQRRATIRDGSFNFAARRGTLAKLNAVPATEIYPFAAAFELPADALRLFEILNSEVRDKYQLEGRRVLCDATGPLYARWAIDVPEPAHWDDAFAEAFACRLAWKCGKEVQGADFDVRAAWSEYQEALSGTKRVDARENPPIGQEESSWILARYNTWGS
ncbi:MAG: hypothetical protein B7Z36_01325 [Novosphingobium sp. 12-63-9]|nr:MAG: hypothetical protein B7Z36_01325 [Novosphingobium sp. 12-63-9]